MTPTDGEKSRLPLTNHRVTDGRPLTGAAPSVSLAGILPDASRLTVARQAIIAQHCLRLHLRVHGPCRQRERPGSWRRGVVRGLPTPLPIIAAQHAASASLVTQYHPMIRPGSVAAHHVRIRVLRPDPGVPQSPSILLLAHWFHPVRAAAVEILVDCDVGH
jgi:hypothetical protein